MDGGWKPIGSAVYCACLSSSSWSHLSRGADINSSEMGIKSTCLVHVHAHDDTTTEDGHGTEMTE